MKKSFSTVLSCVAMGAIALGAADGVPLQLARGGKPSAEIVVPAKADVTLKFAAKELQHWIGKISGAKLPLVNAEKPGVNQIVLDPAASRFPADARALKDNDGYSVRSAAGKVYINASCPKGVLNGVFRMLYKNSDIIWARPHKKKGTFYSEDPDFTLTRTDYIDIPKFVLRGWQFNGTDPGGINNLWQARNGCNWDFIKPDDPTKRKYASAMEYGGGHNLIHMYITEEKYFNSHPEFFSMIDGKRVRPGTYRHLTQLCFTNEELNKTFLKEVVDRVEANPQFQTFRILAEDNYHNCECSECMKPVKLPDGTKVTSKDPAFRSTRFFIFLNRIARYFKQHYPGKRILTYAYYFTVIPPRCQVEDNIDVIFCPIRKNSKFAIDAPECKVVENNYLGWCKVAPNITWRDYYGLCWDFPRPMDRVAFADYRYVFNHGTRRTYTEMRRDEYAALALTPTWNCNSVYFWTMTQACWDPFRDHEVLRKEFFTRVYGEAAADVAEYYKLIEDQWYKRFGNSRWNDQAYTYWQKYVHETGIENSCRAALERAASRNVSGIRKELIADLREGFEKNIAFAKDRDITIPRTGTKVTFDPAFRAAPWNEARVIDRFFMDKTMEADPERAAVRLLGDKKNLYIGIESHIGSKRLKDFAIDKDDPRVAFPYRECFEIYIVGKWKNSCNDVRLFVDPAGNVYSRGRAVGVEYQADMRKNSWSSMLAVPWRDLKITSRNKSVWVQIVRHRFVSSVETIMFSAGEHSVMLSGKYASRPFFCELKIAR